ncbi:MAG TPA: 2-amino-4-hydroxy-6-hydroxymethyldihydropteridine diphosphokinase [Kiritimatiellia bacterium]|nr:2-amino-4-hydroxy-6-hydroxymethyldihydropteridine diphosphokinase [Kiritimatiellia bacterium]
MNGIEAGLSLGANLGDPLATLRAARDAIAAIPEVTLLASAPLYETEPVGVPEEFASLKFYNTVVIVGTSLDAHKLFAHLQKIELALGRKRTLRQNTPRTIDIDMIYYNGQTIRSGGLVIPHPRWTKRRFVLQPLADVRGYLVLPGHDRRVRDILAALPPGQDVTQLMAEW